MTHSQEHGGEKTRGQPNRVDEPLPTAPTTQSTSPRGQWHRPPPRKGTLEEGCPHEAGHVSRAEGSTFLVPLATTWIPPWETLFNHCKNSIS